MRSELDQPAESEADRAHLEAGAGAAALEVVPRALQRSEPRSTRLGLQYLADSGAACETWAKIRVSKGRFEFSALLISLATYPIPSPPHLAGPAAAPALGTRLPPSSRTAIARARVSRHWLGSPRPSPWHEQAHLPRCRDQKTRRCEGSDAPLHGTQSLEESHL